MKKRLRIIFVINSILIAVSALGQAFDIQPDDTSERLMIYRKGISNPVITQNAKKTMRPYLHPLTTPSGKGVLTEIHPSHHLHQTGIYWGLKKVNGRDFFMNNTADYYQFKSLNIVKKSGETVCWETVYDLLNEEGVGILRETQRWALREENGILLLDLEWQGKGLAEVKIEQFYVGGLFMRMPWFEGIKGEVVNAVGGKNSTGAEGQRAVWVDVGMEIDGIKDWGHMAILDHPDNMAFPTPWRVDRQLGVGPSRQILGDWGLKKGEETIERYRIVIYTGVINKNNLDEMWKNYVCESIK